VTAARAIEELVGRRRLHVIVAGDFDTIPEAASVRFWRGRQSLEGTSVCYRDAWESIHPDDPGHTFTPDNPLLSEGTWPQERGRRIDYVMVRCVDHGPTLHVGACARIFDQPVDGVWATDHFGVVADLAVPDTDADGRLLTPPAVAPSVAGAPFTTDVCCDVQEYAHRL
jgi:endonuclease/exonuclease/phosphatase family metal-dependent hydrolase